MNFKQLGLNSAILQALEAQGYQTPTPIQSGAIPPALVGRDVLGIAQTGTGKTCAFATPILQRLAAQPIQGKRVIRSLILTPTRELALQIQESFRHYGARLPLKSAVIFGGVGQQPQVDQIQRGLDILVATPGRLLDLHGQGLVDLSHIEIFVLDEADRMLDMGFIHDVRRVLKVLPEKKQTLFFSATMPPEVQSLVDALLHDPAKVTVTPVSSPVEVIDQSLYFVDKPNKSKLLAYLVNQPGVKNALVFSRTKHGANKIAGDLAKAGISAAAIHGNKSQTARVQALSDFKAGKIKVLAATDIAARGIDIEELSHVFNYNLPDVPETYVHRIGRTGRAGHGGTAISFCDISEKDELRAIEKLLGRKIPVVEDHPWPMENFEPPKRDKNGKIINPEDAEARQAARERKREGRRAGPDGPQRGRAEGRVRPGDQPESEGSRAVSASNPSVTKERRAVGASNPSVTKEREGRRAGPDGPQRGRAEGRVRPGDQPESEGSRAVSASNPSVTKEREGRRAGPDGPQKGRSDRPAAASAPQKTPRPAKVSLSPKEKRQAAGYKASKTLDEALTAVAPKGVDQSAFEKWMAEERKIQAQRGYADPLEGDVVMDATARLLASGRGSAAQSRPSRQERHPRQERGPRPAKVQPAPKVAKVDKATKVDKAAKADKAAKVDKAPKVQPASKVVAPKADKAPAKAEKRGLFGRKAASKPDSSALEERRAKIRQQARDRRARGPVEAPKSGAQLDSTEHASLMKPYYLNDD